MSDKRKRTKIRHEAEIAGKATEVDINKNQSQISSKSSLSDDEPTEHLEKSVDISDDSGSDDSIEAENDEFEVENASDSEENGSSNDEFEIERITGSSKAEQTKSL